MASLNSDLLATALAESGIELDNCGNDFVENAAPELPSQPVNFNYMQPMATIQNPGQGSQFQQIIMVGPSLPNNDKKFAVMMRPDMFNAAATKGMPQNPTMKVVAAGMPHEATTKGMFNQPAQPVNFNYMQPMAKIQNPRQGSRFPQIITVRPSHGPAPGTKGMPQNHTMKGFPAGMPDDYNTKDMNPNFMNGSDNVSRNMATISNPRQGSQFRQIIKVRPRLPNNDKNFAVMMRPDMLNAAATKGVPQNPTMKVVAAGMPHAENTKGMSQNHTMKGFPAGMPDDYNTKDMNPNFMNGGDNVSRNMATISNPRQGSQFRQIIKVRPRLPNNDKNFAVMMRPDMLNAAATKGVPQNPTMKVVAAGMPHAENTNGMSQNHTMKWFAAEMPHAATTKCMSQNHTMKGFAAGMPHDYNTKSMNPNFMNGGDNVSRNMMILTNTPQRMEAEEGEEEEEELMRAETYADYMPSKLKIGMRHPDPVVETSSLSSILPPDVWYNLSIPEEVIDRGFLSALQLEAITYACQQHETILPDGTRAGFLIGDGAGVGKGRTLAGIIYENYLLGRKRAIWLSVSNDLKYDSERDLKDIGAGKIQVHSLSKLKYEKISSSTNGSVKKGVIFATYSSLIGESHSGAKYKTRLEQLLHWCGDDFDGCIVFDECHKAKNLCPAGSTKPTKTGLTVLELQSKLPKARVVYASATGASEPKNMAYMTRLGLWGEGTPFKEFNDFISVVEKRGVGAMELVAMDMKLRGLYMARQLSFSGVTFKIDEIPLSTEFVNMYNQSVALWVEARARFAEAAELMKGDARTKKTMWCQFWASHQRFFKYLCIASKVRHVVSTAREAIKDGKCVVIGLQSTGEARTLEQLEEADGELSDFVSTAKGVFQSLVEKQFPAPDHLKTMKLLGLDTPSSGGGKRKALKRPDGSSSEDFNPSGGSDFEPSGDESPEDVESDDFDASSGSDSEGEYNPFAYESDSDGPWASQRKRKGKKRKNKGSHSSKRLKQSPNPLATNDAAEKASAMKADLLEKIERLGELLPPNTLDQLIDDLGGTENVAEMTGRKGRVVSNDGNIQYESRSEVDAPLETLNIIEKQRFMDGEKKIAIISEAASSGISLQADRRVKNQARRVHITLELPWSADKAVQQFGRTHRSNQMNAPEYLFLISDLAGERRFASIVAKRLESLGALTHGDRRATESRDLSQFNIDTKYGRTALESAMRAIMEHDVPLVNPPYKNFFYEVRKALVGVAMITEDPSGNQTLEKDYNNMSKFMNRILGLPVELQNTLFKYFTDTLDAVIAQAKKGGRYDLGILDLGTGSDLVKRVKVDSFMQEHATGSAKIELHTVLVERGLSWKSALEKLEECSGEDEGFYLSSQVRNNRKTAILAVSDTGRSKSTKGGKLFRVYRPNTGLQAKQETLVELKSKYKKATKKDVEEHWKENYEASATLCSHIYWYGQCSRKIAGALCEVGLRQRQYYVLSGSVLSVWTKIESILSAHHGTQNAKLQVVRLKVEDSRIVGCIIPGDVMNALKKMLAKDTTKVEARRSIPW